eukprot:TRINITY_DN3986_c0_g4_i2.p1 TRINITY_DN3986_c0_g4~~TRINITY_DN3986_c0_g4_i2.p1  ORF type:complete len:786 (+),score=149.23 TRINITY_DN3986_c0_g4_i2:63-2360(+)
MCIRDRSTWALPQEFIKDELLPRSDKLLDTATSFARLGSYDNDLPRTFKHDNVIVTSQRLSAKTVKNLQLKASNGSLEYSVVFPASLNLPSTLQNVSSKEIYYDVSLKVKDFNPFEPLKNSMKSSIIEARVSREAKVSEFLLEETDTTLPEVQIKNLSSLIIIKIPLNQKLDDLKFFEKTNQSSTVCKYYDTSKGEWSTKGCLLLSVSATALQCGCNHLTNFVLDFKNESEYRQSISPLQQEEKPAVTLSAVLEPACLEKTYIVLIVLVLLLCCYTAVILICRSKYSAFEKSKISVVNKFLDSAATSSRGDLSLSLPPEPEFVDLIHEQDSSSKANLPNLKELNGLNSLPSARRESSSKISLKKQQIWPENTNNSSSEARLRTPETDIVNQSHQNNNNNNNMSTDMSPLNRLRIMRKTSTVSTVADVESPTKRFGRRRLTNSAAAFKNETRTSTELSPPQSILSSLSPPLSPEKPDDQDDINRDIDGIQTFELGPPQMTRIESYFNGSNTPEVTSGTSKSIASPIEHYGKRIEQGFAQALRRELILTAMWKPKDVCFPAWLRFAAFSALHLMLFWTTSVFRAEAGLHSCQDCSFAEAFKNRILSTSLNDVKILSLNLILGVPVTLSLHYLLKCKEFWGSKVSVSALVRIRRQEQGERTAGIVLIFAMNLAFGFLAWANASVIFCEEAWETLADWLWTFCITTAMEILVFDVVKVGFKLLLVWLLANLSTATRLITEFKAKKMFKLPDNGIDSGKWQRVNPLSERQ